MSKPYHQVIVGEWVRIPMRKHVDACCDCGLVHVLNYRIVDGTLEMQVARIDKRATAARRRPKEKTRAEIVKRANQTLKRMKV